MGKRLGTLSAAALVLFAVAVGLLQGGCAALEVADDSTIIKICNLTIDELMACRAAATPPSPPPPSRSCCSALSRADVKCLCGFKSSPLLPSAGVDPNLALLLPAKCGLPKPPC